LWSNPCKFGHNFAKLIHKKSQNGIKVPKYQILSIVAKNFKICQKIAKMAEKRQKYQTSSKNQRYSQKLSKHGKNSFFYVPGST
jgi:hypothetical protein